jgi:hypothetical protein
MQTSGFYALQWDDVVYMKAFGPISIEPLHTQLGV